MPVTFVRGEWRLKGKSARCFKSGGIAGSIENSAMQARYGIERQDALEAYAPLSTLGRMADQWGHLFPSQKTELKKIGAKAELMAKRVKETDWDKKKWTPAKQRLLSEAVTLWNRTMSFKDKAGKACGAVFKRK